MNIIYAPTPIPNTPGVFVDITPEPPAAQPLTASMVGMVMEANRGELDTAYDLESLDDFEYFFGVASLDTSGVPLSGHVAARVLFELGVPQVRVVRVAGSQVATGYITLEDGSGNKMVSLHATTPGSWSQGLSLVVTQDSVNNVWGLTVTNTLNPNEPPDVLTGLPFSDNGALITAINASAKLIKATQPVLEEPSAPPTITPSTSSGTVPAGSYFGIATYTNAKGETMGSQQTVAAVLASPGNLSISVPTLTGATGFNIYLTSGIPSSETLAGSGTPGTSLPLTAPWPVSTVRPPTDNTAVTGPGSTSALPAAGTFTIPTAISATGSPGKDATGSGAARHLGSATGGPNNGPSGANALFGYDQDPEIIFFAGTAATDTTQWIALGALASANAAEAVVGFVPATASATARASVLGLTSLIAPGTASGLALKAGWPATQLNDPQLGPLTIPGTAYFAGITAVTPRQTAAYNKPLVPGSNVGQTGWSFVGPDIKATPTDLSNLNDPAMGVYVNVLTARIPASGTGYYTDSMLAPKAATVQQDSFEIRVRTFLARVLYQASGAYFGEVIDQALMTQAETDLTALLAQYANDGLIPQNDAGASNATAAPPALTGKTTTTTTSAAKSTPAPVSQPQPGSGSFVAYQVVCDTTVNTPATMAAGQFIIVVSVVIAPNARQVILVLNAGVSVTITDSTTSIAA